MGYVCVVGHITKDTIRVNSQERELPGGTAYYFSIALRNLGAKVAVVTKLGREDSYLLDDLKRNNIPVFRGKSPTTTVFENSYLGHFIRRKQRVSSIAQPFLIEDVPDLSPSFFHIGSLTKGDIPLKLLRFLSKKCRISLDAQGFLRNVVRGSVKIGDWEEKREALSKVHILKVDKREASILTGEEDVEGAAERLSAFGPEEVIITLGSRGSLIYSMGKFYRIRAYPQEGTVDITGCGDTYMAGYIYQRLKSSDFDEIGKFSSAVASLKLKGFGPFAGSEEDVQAFLKRRENAS